MSDTPEIDYYFDKDWWTMFRAKEYCQEFYRECKKLKEENNILKQQLEDAREVLSEISLYLSVGMGDESTTTEQYHQRILEGIKMLTKPIVEDWKNVIKEINELKAKCNELQKWKESAIKVMPDFQTIGKLLELPLGTDVSSALIDSIKEIKTRHDGLQKEKDVFLEALMQIEEAFIDGDDTYDSWKKMGDIARDSLKDVKF